MLLGRLVLCRRPAPPGMGLLLSPVATQLVETTVEDRGDHRVLIHRTLTDQRVLTRNSLTWRRSRKLAQRLEVLSLPQFEIDPPV